MAHYVCDACSDCMDFDEAEDGFCPWCDIPLETCECDD